MGITVVAAFIVQMELMEATARKIRIAILASIAVVENVLKSLELKQNALQIVNVKTTNVVVSLERRSAPMEAMDIHVMTKATAKALIVVRKDLMDTIDVFRSWA